MMWMPLSVSTTPLSSPTRSAKLSREQATHRHNPTPLAEPPLLLSSLSLAPSTNTRVQRTWRLQRASASSHGRMDRGPRHACHWRRAHLTCKPRYLLTLRSSQIKTTHLLQSLYCDARSANVAAPLTICSRSSVRCFVHSIQRTNEGPVAHVTQAAGRVIARTKHLLNRLLLGTRDVVREARRWREEDEWGRGWECYVSESRPSDGAGEGLMDGRTGAT